MTRVLHLSALGAPPYPHWFFIPNSRHEEAQHNHQGSPEEVTAWCTDQFGPGMILHTLKYRRNTLDVPRWSASLRKCHLILRDDADAFALKMRWC